MERGNELCRLLESYLKQRGEYPAQLGDLVPVFAATLPDSCMGVLRNPPFFYYREQGSYQLGFDSCFFMQFHRGPEGKWQSDD
jgi:hypothetical protein